jgi:hypothetical protein
MYMGVYGRAVGFLLAKSKYEALSRLEQNIGDGDKTYGTIHLFNKAYQLDVKINLKFKIEKAPLLLANSSSTARLGQRYVIHVDVPVELESLDGKFNVKEEKVVEMVDYQDPDVETMILMLSQHGEKAVRYALKALNTIGFSPEEYLVRLSDVKPTEIMEIFKKIGSVVRAHLSDVREVYVRSVDIYGPSVEKSTLFKEIVQEKHGRLKMVILRSKVGNRDIAVIISERGSIYTYSNLSVIEMAETLLPILKEFKKANLIKRK